MIWTVSPSSGKYPLEIVAPEGSSSSFEPSFCRIVQESPQTRITPLALMETSSGSAGASVGGSVSSVGGSVSSVGGSVSSPRLDAVIALVFRLSRGKVTPYIEGGKAFCDGRQVLSAAHQLKEGEVVSVRGLGKFRFLGVEKETRKGRCYVNCELFA